MNWDQFKDPVPQRGLAGAVVGILVSNTRGGRLVTKFSEFYEKI